MSQDVITVPAGRYYLGDPCYSVPDELWMDLLNDCDFFDQPSGTVAGHTVYAFGTAWGDGVYTDQYGNEYPVDAGLIGLVPEEFATKDLLSAVQLITFDRPTICTADDGVLRFGSIIINTADEGDEEEEEEEEDEEDEW